MKTVLVILICIGLLGITLWLGDLSFYNSWAASVDQRRDPASTAIFEDRSNTFFILSSISLAALLSLVIGSVIWWWRSSHREKP